MKQRTLGDKSGFITVGETEVTPFDEAEEQKGVDENGRKNCVKGQANSDD